MFSRTLLSRFLVAVLAGSLFGAAGLLHASMMAAPTAQMSVAGPASGSRASRHSQAAAGSAATPSEISDARAKGMVWVNTKSRTYHTGGRYYGKTKHGRFMTLSDARKAGYKASKR